MKAALRRLWDHRLLIRAGCVCTLIALSVMVAMSLWPIPLLLVLGMGVAHAFGILGVLLFAGAVLVEVSLATGSSGGSSGSASGGGSVADSDSAPGGASREP